MLVQQHPKVLWMLLLVAVGDWQDHCRFMVLFCSTGHFFRAGVLVTGFSLGITAGFISMIPGGLGVQEGSMVGIYTLLGVPIRTAFLPPCCSG